MGTTERQILFGMVETSYGNEPVGLGVTNALRARNVKYNANGERWSYPTASPYRRPTEVGAMSLYNPTLSFESGLHGLAGHVIDATHLPPQMNLLEACGYKSTWHGGTHWDMVWSPYDAKSIWFQRWLCGRSADIGGCRGNVDWELEPRKPVKLTWNFEGMDNSEASEAAFGVPDWTSWGPEMVVKALTFDPWGVYPLVAPKLGRIVKMTIQSRTQLYRQLDINATSGEAGVILVGRGASAEDMGVQVVLDVEQPDAGAAPGSNAEAGWRMSWRSMLTGVPTQAVITNPAASGIAAQTLTISFGYLLMVKEPEDIVLGSGILGHRLTCAVLGSPSGTTEDDLALIWTQL